MAIAIYHAIIALCNVVHETRTLVGVKCCDSDIRIHQHKLSTPRVGMQLLRDKHS